MRRHPLVPLLLALVAASPACSAPTRAHPSPGLDEAAATIHVVRHAWHTGIVLRRQDIAPEAWPEREDFAGAEYLEVGWGARDFYQTPEPTLGMALAAALWPGPSVLHVVGLPGPPERFFAGAEVLEVRLTPAGFAALVAFLRDAHARDAAGRAIALGPGLYGTSRFYLGRKRYSLARTCNVWTATALQVAGLPMTPAAALTAGSVARQVRAAGAALLAPGPP